MCLLCLDYIFYTDVFIEFEVACNTIRWILFLVAFTVLLFFKPFTIVALDLDKKNHLLVPSLDQKVKAGQTNAVFDFLCFGDELTFNPKNSTSS